MHNEKSELMFVRRADSSSSRNRARVLKGVPNFNAPVRRIA